MGLDDLEKAISARESTGRQSLDKAIAAREKPTQMSPEDRQAYALALPGDPSGAKTRADIAQKYGGRERVESMMDPAGKFLGEHAMAMAPWALLGPMGAVPSIAGGALIGALPESNLLHEGAVSPIERGVGAVKGAGSAALGAAVPAVVAGAQRVTGRAYDKLATEMADRIMADAKRLVPAWKDLPDGAAGVRALIEGKGDQAAAAAREAGDFTAHTFVRALRAMKVIDSKTGELDAGKLAEGLSRVMTGGAKSQKFATQLRLNPEAAESLSAASSAARTPSGAAASKETIKMPFLRLSGHGVGAGEGLPLIPYSRNVRLTPGEESARSAAEVVRGLVPPIVSDLSDQILPVSTRRNAYQ